MGSSSSATHPFLVLFFIFLSISSFSHASPHGGGEEALGLWRSVAEGPALAQNPSFILAAERTHRKDPADGLKYYTGGWNISNQHYWTSVAYTLFPLVISSIVWFVGFLLALSLICCCRKRKQSYSSTLYTISLILIIIFIIAASIGHPVVKRSEKKFQRSTSSMLDYVASRVNFTVDNLRNFSNSLAIAKNVSVEQVLLPNDVQSKIDMVEKKLNLVADELASKSKDNSTKIQKMLKQVHSKMDIILLMALVLTYLGFYFGVFGKQFLVLLFVLFGWLLAMAILPFSGIFLLFHNVVADTCQSMEEWVLRPQAHTALDDILPCMDSDTVHESLYQSKEVTLQLANVMNQVISNISNNNLTPSFGPPLYFNQSGPLMPLLCNPYSADMTNRTCNHGEVDLGSASKVWQGYICNTTKSRGLETCTTKGRITPSMYGQLSAAVSISQGLYNYGPFLANLQDCTFVRDAFAHIAKYECPGLSKTSKSNYLVLTLISIAVMFSLLFLLIYVGQRRLRDENKKSLAGGDHPLVLLEKGP